MKTKKCSKCGEDKALTEFHIDRRSADKLCSSCKVCVRERARANYKKRRKLVYGERRTMAFNTKERHKVRDRRQYDRDVLEIRDNKNENRMSEDEAYDLFSNILY